MRNGKPVTFVCVVANRLIDKVCYVRHVKTTRQHMVEKSIRNYRQLASALDVVRICCMVMKKAALSVGQNQPKLRQKNVLLMLKNTMSDKKYGEKHGMKKTRKMAYAHAVVKGKQTQDIVLAHFAGKQ